LQADYLEVFAKLLPSLNKLTENELAEAKKLDRLNLGETIKLCERLRLAHNPDQITLQHLFDAIANVPTSGRPRQSTKGDADGGISFEDAGGYSTIKQQLKEIFIWPMRHPEIFQGVGIRVGNGAILHGPTGCGKTLLARGLASETEFNVIHVKASRVVVDEY
jgi:ATP-dependent 26S proteasome regulatory subunit